MKELVLPPKAQADPKAVEILRAWIADSGLHVSISPGIWEDSGHWGIALADIIRHLADAYQQKGDKAKAIESLEKYITLVDDVSIKAEIQDYINKLKNS